jgi:hypothetical protein
MTISANGHKAYHLLGLPALERGRLGDPKATAYHEEIIERQRLRFEQIRQARFLRPASPRTPTSISTGRLQKLERIVGDHRAIYLHLDPERFWLSRESANYGFIFHAEQLLLERGAILRTHDLLGDYEDLLEEVVEAFVPGSNPEHWSQEEITRLFAALGAPDGNPTYRSPNDVHYELLRAVEDQDLTVPHAREATALLRERASALQAQHQLTGPEAVAFLRSAEGNQAEILLPGKLSLSLACAWIVGGQEIPPVRRGAQRGSQHASKVTKGLPPALRLSGLTFSQEETAALIQAYLVAKGQRPASPDELKYFFRDPANKAQLHAFYRQKARAAILATKQSMN